MGDISIKGHSPILRQGLAQGGRVGFKKGGKVDKKWNQKATASIKRRGTKGKCTPITKKGKRNLRDEKHRIRKELNKGGQVHKAVKTVISPITHVRNLISARLIKGKPKIAKKGWK